MTGIPRRPAGHLLGRRTRRAGLPPLRVPAPQLEPVLPPRGRTGQRGGRAWLRTAAGDALTRPHGAASLRASRSGTSRFLLSQALWSGASLPRSRKGRDRPGPARPPLLRSHDSPCTFLEGEGTTRAPEACRGEGAGAGTVGSPPSPQRSTADRGSPGTRHRTGVPAPRLRAARPRGCAG